MGVSSDRWGFREIIIVNILYLSIRFGSRLASSLLFPTESEISAFTTTLLISAGQMFLIPVIFYYVLIVYQLNLNQVGIKIKGSLTPIIKSLKLAGILMLIFILTINLPSTAGIVKLEEINPLIKVSSFHTFADSLGYFIIIFPVFILPILAEELFFRGFLYDFLKRRIGIILGCITNSLLFSVFQFNLTQGALLTYFFIGLFCVIIFEISESLLPEIFFRAFLKTSLIIYITGWNMIQL